MRDQDIAELFKSGEEDKAFDLLYDKYSLFLSNIIYETFAHKDNNDVQDIKQIVFEKLFYYLKRGGEVRGDLKTFLVRIAKNELINRKKAFYRKFSVCGSRDDMEVFSGSTEDTFEDTGDEYLVAFLKVFNEEVRDLLSLNIEGYRYPEIAGFRGLELHTVKNKLWRVKLLLASIGKGKLISMSPVNIAHCIYTNNKINLLSEEALEMLKKRYYGK